MNARPRLLIGCLAGVAVLVGALFLADRAFPPPLERFHDRSRLALDRTGAPLRAFMSGDQKWRLHVTPADVDPLYLSILKAYEDKRFDRHFGVDPLATLRAIGQAVRAGRAVSGASTLTMQAARLLEPAPPRSLRGKLRQTLRALQLEARFTKAEILSIYLTLAPFGGPVEGVRSASLKLFGREPKLLTAAEAALLTALPQSPNARRPDRRPAGARRARARVLDRAVDAGVLSSAEAAEAKAAPLPAAYLDFPFHAPHLAERLVGEGAGRQVETTVDLRLQRAVENRLRAALADLPAPTTAAALVVDAATAEVRAHVGGPDYFDVRRAGMTDMTRALRSPGSALKPFIYGLAFDRLIATPETVISDRPFREQGYAPSNFDTKYAGDVSAADALRRSLNIPAVKLLRRLGPARFDAAMATAGVELTFDRESGDQGLAMALGGVGVPLEDLARAFVAFARDGRAPQALRRRPSDPLTWRRLISTEAAGEVREALASTPPPAGHDLSDGGRAPVAYKTGTSYGYRDALAVGVAGGHVIAVWVGRPDGASCQGCVGVQAAAPILFDIAELLPEAPPWPALPRRPTPPHLARAGPGLAPGMATFERRPLTIGFPVNGGDLRLGSSGRSPLRAEGGAPPYRWLANGRPIGMSRRGTSLPWTPDGDGRHHIRVLDATGVAAEAEVRILSP